MERTSMDVSKLKKCRCSGTPEVLRDTQDDFIIRCTKCHESTYAHMYYDCVEEAWNAGDTIGKYDIELDDINKEMGGEIDYIYMGGYVGFIADANDLPEDYDKRLLITNDDGSLELDDTVVEFVDGRKPMWLRTWSLPILEMIRMKSYGQEKYSIKIGQSVRPFRFESAEYDDNGNPTVLRFIFGDGLLIMDGRNEIIYAEDNHGIRIPVDFSFVT